MVSIGFGDLKMHAQLCYPPVVRPKRTHLPGHVLDDVTRV